MGSPVANRNRLETESLIGFFVNTLVLRSEMAGNPSFQHLLARTREVTLGAYGHQDIPFEKLVQDLAPHRAVNRTPLFQVMLALRNTAPALPGLPDLETELLEVSDGTVKFDLSLSVALAAEGMAASLEYDLDLFDGTTAGRFAVYLQTLLACAVAAPQRRLSDLEILGEAELRQILQAGRREAAEHEDESCVHELILAQAAGTPDAVAVESGGATELPRCRRPRRTDCRRLTGLGIGPEKTVGLSDTAVAAGRSPAVLGILQAGGRLSAASIPRIPGSVWNPWLRDSGTRVLLTVEPCGARRPSCRAVRSSVSTGGWKNVARRPLQPLQPLSATVDPANLAYVIYTSGLTGTPKSVGVSHGGATAHPRTSRASSGSARASVPWRWPPGASTCRSSSSWSRSSAARPWCCRRQGRSGARSCCRAGSPSCGRTCSTLPRPSCSRFCGSTRGGKRDADLPLRLMAAAARRCRQRSPGSGRRRR